MYLKFILNVLLFFLVIYMNDLQKCQFEILKEFIRVCEENNLQYYLIGGTCLGAVRHQGFIPWDDDIDVALPRDDYEKFIKLQSQFPSYYFLQNYKTDPRFVYNYTKIRDSRTTYIENFFRTVNQNHGVWIDVFPLDGMSYKIKPACKFKGQVYRIWRNVWLMYPRCLLRKVRVKTFFKDILCNFVAILFWPSNIFHWRNKYIDSKIKKIPYKEAALVGNILGTNPKKEAMDPNIFLEGSTLKFEGMDVKVPKDYDKYLSNLYGDYMKLPPIEKQVGHHHDKGFSLTQNYLDYRKEHKI